MYKKFLWLSALTACFVTVFFAILGFTKVNPKFVEYAVISTCRNLNTPPITDDSKPNEPLQHQSPQPRSAYTSCPKEDKEIQPRKDCEHCPHCPKHDAEKTTSQKHGINCKQCLKEMADDSTEDNLINVPQILEQQRHLPHYRNSHMHIWDYLSPLFATMPFNPSNSFDLKYKNAFTIEIVENRDDNGWHFYINGQEVQPNMDNQTNNLPNNVLGNTPENTPVPLPELGDNTPRQPEQMQPDVQPQQPEQMQPDVQPQQPEQIRPNIRPQQPEEMQPNMQPQQPEQPQQNTAEDQQHEDSTLLPEQTPYM